MGGRGGGGERGRHFIFADSGSRHVDTWKPYTIPALACSSPVVRGDDGRHGGEGGKRISPTPNSFTDVYKPLSPLSLLAHAPVRDGWAVGWCVIERGEVKLEGKEENEPK